MKKISALIIAAVMLISLCACSGSDGEKKVSKDAFESATATDIVAQELKDLISEYQNK